MVSADDDFDLSPLAHDLYRVVLALRIYALYYKNKRALLPLLTVLVITIGLDIVREHCRILRVPKI